MSRLISLGRADRGQGAISSQDFLAYCSAEDVKLIFEQLLAPPLPPEAEQSFHCSLTVLKCIEKYYCWLGIHQGYLQLTRRPPCSSSCPARNYFTVLRPMTEHCEWQVFLSLVMTVTEVTVRNLRFLLVELWVFRSEVVLCRCCCCAAATGHRGEGGRGYSHRLPSASFKRPAARGSCGGPARRASFLLHVGAGGALHQSSESAAVANAALRLARRERAE